MLFHFKRAAKITNKKSRELTQKAKQVASLDERHKTMPYFSQRLSTNEKTAVMAPVRAALCRGADGLFVDPLHLQLCKSLQLVRLQHSRVLV